MFAAVAAGRLGVKNGSKLARVAMPPSAFGLVVIDGAGLATLHGASATTWCSDWRIRRTLSPASRAAMGSDAFPFAGQQQAGAIVFQRNMTIGVPCGFSQALDLCRKALFLWLGAVSLPTGTILQ
jgi:hypothetical protein